MNKLRCARLQLDSAFSAGVAASLIFGGSQTASDCGANVVRSGRSGRIDLQASGMAVWTIRCA